MRKSKAAVSILVIALALGTISAAQGQELLITSDGVTLNGTVRLLRSDAATCNVVAENAGDRYDELKANQGQPLHLWELEFSVYNGSGRSLDHLIAYYSIESPWPPCTNWTNHYEPEGIATAPVQWVSPSGRIQKTGRATPTHAGETHSETVLLLAFHGVRPQFSDWSVNYRFVDGPAEPLRPTRSATDTEPAPWAEPATPVVPTEVSSGTRCSGKNYRREDCWVEIPGHRNCYVWLPALSTITLGFPRLAGFADSLVRPDAAPVSAWKGQCLGGLAHGTWTLTRRWYGTVTRIQGAFVQGRRHGTWESKETFESEGSTYENKEGEFSNGRLHGIVRGSRDMWGEHQYYENQYVNGKLVGDGLIRRQ